MCITFEIIAAYLCGSIPFGLVLSSLFGKGDLRSEGSGNIGATNVLRTQGKLLGFMTFLLDAIKGIIPVLYCTHSSEAMYSYIIFTVVIIGHVFPIWLKFKGGKGIATFFGALIALHPLFGLLSIAVWFITFKLSQISSLSGLVSVTAGFIMLVIHTCCNQNFKPLDLLNTLPILFAVLIIFYKHLDNIKRLLSGTENKIKL